MTNLFRWIGLAAVAVLLVLMIGPFQGLERSTGLSDKIMHAGAFGLITAVALLNFPRLSRIQAIGLVSFLGVAVELIQGATGRDADVYDALADLIGAVVVAGVWWSRKVL